MKTPRSTHLVAFILLLLATACVYLPIRNHEFINLDDPVYITGNEHVVTGVSLENVQWAFTHMRFGYWHPVTWISHMMDVELFGLRAGGHHMANLLLHLLNTALVLLFFTRTTRRPGLALFVAAFFAVHPLRVESVAWAAERKDVLSAFFWLLTMHAYTWYALRPGRRRYALLLLTFAVGCMSKPMLVTLPVALLLLDLWPLGRWQPAGWKHAGPAAPASPARLLAEKVPLLAMAVVLGLVTWWGQHQLVDAGLFTPPPVVERVGRAAISLVSYIVMHLLPAGLSPVYPYAYATPTLTACLAGVTLLGITAIVAGLRRTYLLAGWCWFLLLLLPVLGIIPFGSTQLGDRFTYLPSLGLLAILAWGLAELTETRWPGVRRALPLAAVFLWLASAVLTFRQVAHWENSFTLYEHVIRVTRNNWVAHNNLGAALQKAGRTDEAIWHYRTALTISPTFADAYHNLANTYLASGNPEKARTYYARALETQPDFPSARKGLAMAEARLGSSTTPEAAGP